MNPQVIPELATITQDQIISSQAVDLLDKLVSSCEDNYWTILNQICSDKVDLGDVELADEILKLPVLRYDGGNPVTLNQYIIAPDAKIPLHEHYFIEYRGTTGWAIIHSPFCMSRSLKDFVYEPSPSNRTDEDIKDMRFLTVTEAYCFLKNWKKEKLIEAKKNPAYKDWTGLA